MKVRTFLWSETTDNTVEFFHNSRLIRWTPQKEKLQNIQTWPGIEPRSLAQLSATVTITLECFCACVDL